MKQLAGDTVGPVLLQSLRLHRLPEGIRAILACADSGFLNMLATTTDKIPEGHSRPMVGEVSGDAPDKLAKLQHSMAKLANTVSALHLRQSLRNRSRSASRSRSPGLSEVLTPYA